MIKIFLAVLFVSTQMAVFAQVNAYARVTGISGTVLNVSNVNEVYHTFNAGEKVVVMQMQDNVIGGTANDADFGSLGSIGSAGLYEVATISTVTPTTITLTAPLLTTFATGTNASVQVISFRLLGSPNYTTTANITALDWDGNVGGVVAIQVNGVLTLAHSITANGAGFRGGDTSNNQGTVDCNIEWITSNRSESGEKGEGIYLRTSNAQRYGRAKILNGGGGGNRHNAGGGGGGNVTEGGLGGPGYQCTGSPVGGQGGLSLSAYITSSRIFMGGGGGGGQRNNSIGTSGADGGGIILIRANSLVTTGACAGVTISANGSTAADAGNDGAGGGGAAGSIVMDVDSYTISGTCALSVQANGGNGGRSNNGTTHGGGGGGGQGRVIFSGAIPANTTVTTNNGTSGCNNNSSPCNSIAGPPSGVSGSGISNNNGITPLPVKLVYFTGAYNASAGSVELKWATATEINNDYFIIERSADGRDFETVVTLAGNGSSNKVNRYAYEDTDLSLGNQVYYRLSQVDFDGTMEQLKVIHVNWEFTSSEVWIYPIPVSVNESLFVDIQGESSDIYQISVIDMQGIVQLRFQTSLKSGFESVALSMKNLQEGIYTVRIESSSGSIIRKIVVF